MQSLKKYFGLFGQGLLVQKQLELKDTWTIILTEPFLVTDDNYTVLEASTNERLRLVCGLKPRSQVPAVLWYKDGQLVDGQSKRITQQRQWLVLCL